MREGIHYKGREKKEDKDEYSIKVITVECTGVSKDNDDFFPAAKIRVRRILDRIIAFTGEERLKTDISFKPAIIRIVKKAYFSEYGMENLKNMLNNKLEVERFKDSDGEDNLWSTLSIIESIVDIPTEKLLLFENESQEFKDIVSKILDKVHMDMISVSVLIWDKDKKNKLISEYLEDLIDEDQSGFFESWRTGIRKINHEATFGVPKEIK